MEDFQRRKDAKAHLSLSLLPSVSLSLPLSISRSLSIKITVSDRDWLNGDEDAVDVYFIHLIDILIHNLLFF